jgi:hypothetical protein
MLEKHSPIPPNIQCGNYPTANATAIQLVIPQINAMATWYSQFTVGGSGGDQCLRVGAWDTSAVYVSCPALFRITLTVF